MKSLKRSQLFSPQIIFILLFLIVSMFSAFVPHFKLDLLISEKIQSINSTLFGNLMWFVSSIGNQPIMLFIVVFTSSLLFLFKYKTEAVISSLAAAGSALSGSLIKVLVDRPRPTIDLVNVSVWLSDKSYPSNHVLVFTVYFGFLLYLFFYQAKHKVRWLLPSIFLFLLITSIGFSRIYLGAHWASDVLGGYLLGILWLILAIKLYNSYHGKR